MNIRKLWSLNHLRTNQRTRRYLLQVWCSIWLAVDVWVCTASILHLVVISLDRYIAVTHPITYPNIMTSKRAKLLILGAWVLSFVICFPPLVGWNDRTDHQDVPFPTAAASNHSYHSFNHHYQKVRIFNGHM